eukprot:symbB.v1.2.030427.t1/scaffold3249.1/size60221/3
MVKFVRRPASKRSSRGGVIQPQFPKALVINLARRRDRWNEVEDRLRRIKGLRFDRLEAVDGTSETIATNGHHDFNSSVGSTLPHEDS